VRLLLDENLSEALLPALADLFPNSLHIRTHGLTGASDLQIWELARAHDCALLTRDEDFIRLSLSRGAPPKVIWITLGNCSNATLIALIRGRYSDIEAFLAQDEATVLALGVAASAG
jgi:predicted nuclease of predicted toxin-antitoxin system